MKVHCGWNWVPYKGSLTQKSLRWFVEKSLLYADGLLRTQARLEIEIGYEKSINRETWLVGVDNNLYTLSKKMEQYWGYRIREVDPIHGIVSFTNGESIHVGKVTRDVSEADLRRVQIRETIRSHLEKEKELFNRGNQAAVFVFYRRDGEVPQV